MAYLKRADCELYYEVYGSGEPLLMLHGNGEDSSYFEHQITYFQQYYQVIVMDMRGHGKSSFGRMSLNFSLFAEDVVALLKEFHYASVHVLGFSDGGNTALTLALEHPSYVRSLILNGADASPKGVKKSVQIPIVIGYAILWLCALCSKNARKKKEIMGLMVRHPHISIEDLHKISVASLVLVGNKDMIKEEHSQCIAKTLQNAQCCILEGSHFIAHENPIAYNQAVEKFLIKQTKAGVREKF